MASLQEPLVVEASSADAFVAAIDSLRNWRSIEVFGPPGAGKSHLCRQASAELGVLTMCDRQAVRFYSAIDFPKTTAVASALLGRRRLRNYYGFRLGGYRRRFREHAGDGERAYLAATERLRDALSLPRAARRRFDNRVEGSAGFIARALSEGRSIVADEGLLNQLNSAVARTVGDAIVGSQLDLVRECLAAYPWDKSALIVDASVATCIRRQQERGHLLFTPDRPQPVFHEVTNLLERLCREAGWRTARINND